MPQPKRQAKTEYLNRTQGWMSVRKIDRRGEEKNFQLAPGDRVFMTAEEVELTAQSHKTAAASPFVAKPITWRALSTGEHLVTFEAAPLTAAGDLPDELPEVKAMEEFRRKQAEELERENPHPALN